MTEDVPLPSPRTPEEPMAFTRSEFWRGALSAWCVFVVLLTAALILLAVVQSSPSWGPPLSMIAVYLMFGVPVGSIVAAIVTVVAAPGAWLLGRGLVRCRRIPLHVAAYFAFGFVIGFLVLLVTTMSSGTEPLYALSHPDAWGMPVLGGLAVTGGWVWNLLRIRRYEAPRRPRFDPDAAYEDGV